MCVWYFFTEQELDTTFAPKTGHFLIVWWVLDFKIESGCEFSSWYIFLPAEKHFLRPQHGNFSNCAPSRHVGLVQWCGWSFVFKHVSNYWECFKPCLKTLHFFENGSGRFGRFRRGSVPAHVVERHFLRFPTCAVGHIRVPTTCHKHRHVK